ncbi:hypothetical protein JAAARDRAFT_95974, partial [Jaapia argillacea MUCL 33604]
PSFRCGIHQLLIRLSQNCQALPASLFVSGITVCGKDPVAGGGFADIFQAWYDRRLVAIKRFRVFQSSPREQLELRKVLEALIWKQLHHDHILPFLGIDTQNYSSQFFCMVSPWMQNGNILKYLASNPPESVDLDRLLLEAARGLNYIHSMDIVHGDLRGGNILIDNKYRACLADFGLANFADTTKVATTKQHGSTRWMAPELVLPERFGVKFRRTFASDVYAFGCVCVEVYTGCPPFSAISNDCEFVMKLLTGYRPGRPSPANCGGRSLPDELWQLIQRCWSEEAIHRP